MNALARASKQALQTAARGFASGAYPDRKVAVLGAAGERGHGTHNAQRQQLGAC